MDRQTNHSYQLGDLSKSQNENIYLDILHAVISKTGVYASCSCLCLYLCSTFGSVEINHNLLVSVRLISRQQKAGNRQQEGSGGSIKTNSLRL